VQQERTALLLASHQWCCLMVGFSNDRLLFVRERAAGAYGTVACFTSVVLFDGRFL